MLSHNCSVQLHCSTMCITRNKVVYLQVRSSLKGEKNLPQRDKPRENMIKEYHDNVCKVTPKFVSRVPLATPNTASDDGSQAPDPRPYMLNVKFICTGL